jgi:glutathione-regulated potassium-efflux system ancillary protein KefG
MKVLVLFAHPRFETSIVQRKLLDQARGMDTVTIHDLYQSYPDFHIDVEAEKSRLIEHDVIILQHPFYWYSVPAIVKEWLDLVLEFNWAYGPSGTALHGKFLMSVLSTGGDEHAYHPHGRNRFPIDSFLSPLNQTAHLCGMGWLRPFIVFSGRRMSSAELDEEARKYRALLGGLNDGSINPMELLAPGYDMPDENLRAG